MPLIDFRSNPLSDFEKFQDLYFGFPYGFEVEVRKLLWAPHNCSNPLAYARLLQAISKPVWQLSYARDPETDVFRAALVAAIRSLNADIMLVPEIKRWAPALPSNVNMIRMLHHTMGRGDQQWHYKVAYLPGFYHFDRDGYSGWSELRGAASDDITSVSIDIAKTYYESRIKSIKNDRLTKYSQNDTEYAGVDNFIFMPLQVVGDSVISLAFSEDYVGVMREAGIHILDRGLPLVIKRHPMCNDVTVAEMLLTLQGRGAVITDASIHNILPRSSAVVTLNSGVGFEALTYLKPVICLGKSDYSYAGWEVKNIVELGQALDSALTDGVDEVKIKRFLYLTLNKYQVDLRSQQSVERAVLRALAWNYLSGK